MEGGKGYEGLVYFILTLACIVAVPILILIWTLIHRAKIEMRLEMLSSEYKAIRVEYEESLIEKVAIKQACLQLSEYPDLYAEYERAVNALK